MGRSVENIPVEDKILWTYQFAGKVNLCLALGDFGGSFILRFLLKKSVRIRPQWRAAGQTKQWNSKQSRPWEGNLSIMTILVLTILSVVFAGTVSGRNSDPSISLTLIPPSPVTDQIILSIRGAVWNHSGQDETIDVTVYLDNQDESGVLHREKLIVSPKSAKGIYFRWPTKNHTGVHKIIFSARTGETIQRVVQPLEIRASDFRSTGTIDGAWCGFYMWGKEGLLWNDELVKMTDNQWRELVRAMGEIGMNIIVEQEVFRNHMYVDEHSIERDGYHGKAFYPSKLFSGRMPIESKDPLKAILTEADERGMFVFVPIGLYAWFDFTPGSLKWHKKVATELWERYGHHPSFYGWYISEEIHGSLSPNDTDEAIMKKHHDEIVHFFKEFQAHVRALAPDKPVMLASNCHWVKRGLDVYPSLLNHLDILCPFGFHRMPKGDMTGEEAAMLLQKLCNDAGAHLWLDVEAFLFGKQEELYPRPIKGLTSDLNRFQNFEKILCFQFPGLFNAPWASRKPGGPATVKLYQDYKRYFESKKREFLNK